MDLDILGPIFSDLDLFEKVNVTEEVQYCFTFIVIKHIFLRCSVLQRVLSAVF